MRVQILVSMGENLHKCPWYFFFEYSSPSIDTLIGDKNMGDEV